MQGPFCEYKDILGKPHKGFHATRVDLFGGSFARNDIIGTFIIAIIIAIVFDVSVVKSIIGAFALGFISHWLFCVDTESAKILSRLFE